MGNWNKEDISVLDDLWCRESYERNSHWIDELSPTSEAEFPQQTGLIGKQFESIVAFWFANDPKFELIAHSLQIFDEGKTIGELDFILRDLDLNKHIHLEVACKFYLSSQNSSNWSSWIGPNGTDNLDLKMKKLDKQLKLSSDQKCRAVLQELGIDSISPHVLLKGRFFHHISNLSGPKNPNLANKNYCTGWWAFEEECLAVFSPGTHWAIPDKEFWFGDYVCSEQNDVLDHNSALDRIRHELVRQKPSPIVHRMSRTEEGWVESSRGFVVRNDWP